MVRRFDLHRFLDKARIRDAIAEAERSTSAPIHVSIAPYFWGNVQRTAERAFRKHGLARTRDRNGVLFFVVPSRRQFVVIGDVGAHEALGQTVWESVAAIMQEQFACGNPTIGMALGIETIGRALARHFPRE
jgi:uncharacterized membrane protein